MMLAAILATLTLVLYLAAASFGPERVRIALLWASTSDLSCMGIMGLVVFAVVRL